MPFCRKCGKEVLEGKFCPYCGNPIGEAPTVPEGVPTMPPPPSVPPQGIVPPPAPPGPGGFAPSPKAIKPVSKAATAFGVVGAVSVGIAAIGSISPWFKLMGTTYTGWGRDGTLTLFLSIIGLAFFLVGFVGRARWPFIVGLVLCIIITIIIIIDIKDVSSNASPAFGMYLVLAGGIVGVVSGIGGIASRREQ